ncbi:MAG: O-methyltransferase [Saprospiraceae bacterium]|nr:O-methyltransferase [Saprospiraceae bacterium]
MISTTEQLYEYCETHSTAEDRVLAILNRETHIKTLAPNMLSGHLQGNLLTMVSMMMQPGLILEIGTFTGYSAICLAKGLRQGGRLISIDISEDYRHMAEKAICEAGLETCIELITADAKKIIHDIQEKIDLVFIDADKEAYLEYYHMVKPKMRPGGVIIADNVLWKGKVLDADMDKKTRALHEFNAHIRQDQDVFSLILPIRDGLNIVMIR